MKFVTTTIVALALVLGGLGSSVAFGQASRLGDTFGLRGLVPSRHADIAYDPLNDVFLMVSYGTPGGANRSFGRFVSGAGAPIGAEIFGITTSGVEAARPRAAYGRGQFLVTWFDWRATKNGQVYARFVQYDPATGNPVFGPEILLATAVGLLNPETSTAAIAYSTADDEFLVTWQEVGGSALDDIRAQRISSSGALLGDRINITFDNHYQADPAVAYDRAANLYYIAWRSYTEPRGPAGISGRRVQSGTGALLDAEAQVLFTATGTWLPMVVNNPSAGHFFVGWYTNAPSPTHYGMLMGTNGAVISPPAPVVVNYPSYDGFDVAHNPITNTYFAVFHSRNPRPPFEVVGQELLPTARPAAQAEFEVTATGAQRGTYYPSLAASTRAPQWTAVVALEFTSIVGQRIQSGTDGGGSGPIDPPPPTDDEVKPDPTAFDFASASNGTEFFAEGVASADSFAFNTYYQIQNDNDLAASVRAYFARQTSDGSIVLKERLYQVPANGRRTIDLKASVGLGPWSAIFQSMTAGAPVTTQQSVLWGPNLEGSSSETGVRAASSQWLFAEGTRGGNDYFSNFFLLFNPNPQPITVVGEYFSNGASQPVYRGHTVPPYSRYTIFANGELPGLANQDFSTRFFTENGSLFVAQRAMYWGPGFAGGHTAVGANAANATWMFAEGAAAPDFDTYFTLLNPNGFEVTVNAVFLTEAFGPVAPSAPLTVKPYSRQTVWANGVLGNVGAFGATFTTVGGHGIVVERSVYWGKGGFPNWVEGTNDLGVNAPATTWRLPEGSDSGSFDTFVLVANPNGIDVNVEVAFYVEGGGRYTMPVKRIGAGRRLTIDMNAPAATWPDMSAQDAVDLKGKSFAVKVTSLTPNGPVIVEEAVYRNWDPANYWRAGSSAFGVAR